MKSIETNDPLQDFTIGVVGLGYVGLPVAVAFGKKQPVVGFDISRRRVEQLQQGLDVTGEVMEADLKAANLDCTTDARRLKNCNFVIVAVPTPINEVKQPDLTPLLKASRTVGENLSKGSIVVFESTVYPGATEEECVPVLEQYSGLRCGTDFFVGYSPERINPGDKVHTFETIIKVVAGQTPEITEKVAAVYGAVVTAGAYLASSIKVAEAAKVIENTQRDVNIALMNELALIFHKLGIDTGEVLAAAGTKWNFLPFTPGLVGGHCIGVDPYYLTHKAQSIGYHPEVILSGRRINDNMGKYIVSELVKRLIQKKVNLQNARVTVLGLAFKENVPDLRNTRVVDIIDELKDYGLAVQVADPVVDPADAREEYGIQLTELADLEKADAVILAVPHRQLTEKGWTMIAGLLKEGADLVADVKGVLPTSDKPAEITLWRL